MPLLPGTRPRCADPSTAFGGLVSCNPRQHEVLRNHVVATCSIQRCAQVPRQQDRVWWRSWARRSGSRAFAPASAACAVDSVGFAIQLVLKLQVGVVSVTNGAPQAGRHCWGTRVEA